MTWSKIKSALVAGLLCSVIAGIAHAATDDSTLKLNSAAGTTEFAIQNNTAQDIFMVTSLGNVLITTNTIMPGTTFFQNGAVGISGNVGVGVQNATSRLQVTGGDLGLGDGSTATGNQPVTVWLTNKSGGATTQGCIVIIGGNDNSYTTTAVANTNTALGVVYDASIANNAVGRVAVAGVALVQTSGATTRGNPVQTGGVVCQAGNTAAPGTIGARIGIYLESLGIAGNARVLLGH
jgi:hypothetical protein